MKLEVGEYYLSAGGEIFKIDSYKKGEYPFKTKNNYSYKQDGRYNQNSREFDLIAHIPKQLHKHILNEINNYYTDKDFKEVVDSVWDEK